MVASNTSPKNDIYSENLIAKFLLSVTTEKTEEVYVRLPHKPAGGLL